MTLSARSVGWSKANAYYHRGRDENFSSEWENARNEAADWIEAEAWHRAIDGIDKPVYYKGEIVDVVKKYSDTLLIFLLKEVRPEKYREKYKINMGTYPHSTKTLDEILKEDHGKSLLTQPNQINVNCEIDLIGIKQPKNNVF